MADFQLKENSFSLFKNNKKEQETHCDMSGKINVGGELYYLNAWEKKTQSGEIFYSGTIKKIIEKLEK